jgi:nucleoside-diphosphate-sugar epimerase
MSEKKLITVFGATGSQGGGLANAILNDDNSKFSVRAVTRDPSSDKAKALSEAGAEVVKGDVDDYDSIKKHLTGRMEPISLPSSGIIFRLKRNTNRRENMQKPQKKPDWSM